MNNQPPRRRRPIAARLRLAVPALLLCCATGVAYPQSLDELLDLDPAPKTEPTTEPATTPAEDPAAPAADEKTELEKQLAAMREKAAADYKAAANALESAVQEMDDVAKRLSQGHDPSVETQRIQEQIISKLDQMIEAAKQQKQQQSSSSSSSPSNSDSQSQQQAEQSSPGQSSPGQPQGNQAHQGGVSPGSVTNIGDTLKPLEELKQEWGQLPPRLRDELSEGLGERFSPVYRLMTEAYYRRLAEEAGDQ